MTVSKAVEAGDKHVCKRASRRRDLRYVMISSSPHDFPSHRVLTRWELHHGLNCNVRYCGKREGCSHGGGSQCANSGVGWIASTALRLGLVLLRASLPSLGRIKKLQRNTSVWGNVVGEAQLRSLSGIGSALNELEG